MLRAAASSSPGITCEYVSMVRVIEKCPSADWTTTRWTLVANNAVAKECRTLHLDGGEVTFSIAAASGNMAKMIYGAEKDAAGNGGGAV